MASKRFAQDGIKGITIIGKGGQRHADAGDLISLIARKASESAATAISAQNDRMYALLHNLATNGATRPPSVPPVENINITLPSFPGIEISPPDISYQAPDISLSVPPPTVNISIPEQPAPIVNVEAAKAPDVTVNVPKQPTPKVTVNVPKQKPPDVKVTVEQPPPPAEKKVEFQRDQFGNITGAEIKPED